MYKGMVESILVMVLAALGLADAWRLSNVVRAGKATSMMSSDRTGI